MGIVEKLKKEFDFEEEWISYELHPDTPEAGVAITERFPDLNLAKFRAGLNSKSEQYGLRFGNFSHISNSRIALQVGELARELGVYNTYHDKIFEAYFVDALDIGSKDVVLSVAGKSGIERHLVNGALESGRFLEKLEQARKEGSELGVTAVPTFIIDGKIKLVGALSYGRFRKALLEQPE